MRHHNKNKKLGRERNQRRALLRSLAVSLLKKGRIETTETKAKALRPYVEKMITKGRKGDLATRRLLFERLGGQEKIVKKIVEEISPKYKDRDGGYLRIIRTRKRIGSDGAQMALIELI